MQAYAYITLFEDRASNYFERHEIFGALSAGLRLDLRFANVKVTERS